MRRWVLLLLLLAGIFAGLRGVHALADPASVSAIYTDQVVVVGVTGRDQLNDTDRQVLADHSDDAQAGTMSIRARAIPDCAAAGWTTLGAGRRAAVGGLCDPQVANGAVVDWDARTQAAAASRGDAQLGTLAGSVAGCVGAVGPGAALAAAKPDGTVADYRTPDAFLADGLKLSCPVTLVDAGGRSDAVITQLAARDDVTLIVTGVGPAPGSEDRSLQVVYRLGTTLPGWLTSASTRREGIVTLTDLTRTLIDFAPASPGVTPLTVDGSPFTVQQDALTVPRIEAKVDSVAALSDAAPIGYLALGAVGSVLFAALVVGVVRRRWTAPRVVFTLASVLAAAMMLCGSAPWASSSRPGVYVSVLVWTWAAILTAGAFLLGRRLAIPAPIAAAALTVAAFTVDAALGGPMQPGSLLNSRPIYGLRWYGFGNVTFAVYATSGLLLAGYVAHRLLAQHRRRAAVIAVAAIGFGIVICEGWPSMGTDFGGVIALTPPVLWLLLVLSGVRITWPKLLVVGASAVVAIGAISLADWSRGPDRRSHLGNFVQRVVDGDAVDVISRKAVASFETIFSVGGLACVVIGTALWIVMYRYAEPALRARFTTLRTVMIAVMATAILGTLLNDGGISVWLTATAAITVVVGALWFDQAYRERKLETSR